MVSAHVDIFNVAGSSGYKELFSLLFGYAVRFKKKNILKDKVQVIRQICL